MITGAEGLSETQFRLSCTKAVMQDFAGAGYYGSGMYVSSGELYGIIIEEKMSISKKHFPAP